MKRFKRIGIIAGLVIIVILSGVYYYRYYYVFGDGTKAGTRLRRVALQGIPAYAALAWRERICSGQRALGQTRSARAIINRRL